MHHGEKRARTRIARERFSRRTPAKTVVSRGACTSGILVLCTLHCTMEVLSITAVCMVTYTARVWINRVRFASPARGQLNRKNVFFPCLRLCLRIWSRETGSAIPSRVSLLISILRLNLVLTYGFPPVSPEVPRNPLTRWDVSSTSANEIVLPKKLLN